MNFIDGWWEIQHIPTYEIGVGTKWHWKPREVWCTSVFKADEWYLREAQYDHPTHKNTVPITWMFKNEKDAFMYVLRWS